MITVVFYLMNFVIPYSVIPYNVPTIHHTYVQGDMWICGGPTNTWDCGCVCGLADPAVTRKNQGPTEVGWGLCQQ